MAALVSGAGQGPALAQREATATRSTGSDLPLRLAQLQELDGAALREEWRRVVRSDPPRLSRDLLMRALAYRLQERELGGLPKWARLSLSGAATAADPDGADGTPTSKPAPAMLKPGARLVREWHGRTHSVLVLDDGFEFEGRRYRSLTQIAREITGAHWSGPRFFGLTKRNSERALAPQLSTPETEPREIRDAAPSGLLAPPIGGLDDPRETCRPERRAWEDAYD